MIPHRTFTQAELSAAWAVVGPEIERRCWAPAALRWLNPGTPDAALLAVAQVVAEDGERNGFVFVTQRQREDYMHRWLKDNEAHARREAAAVTLAWAMEEDGILWLEDPHWDRALHAIGHKTMRQGPWTAGKQLLALVTAKIAAMPSVGQFGDGQDMAKAARDAVRGHAPQDVAEDYLALVGFVLGQTVEFAARFLEGGRFVELERPTIARMARALGAMLGRRGQETGSREQGTEWLRARKVPFAVPVIVLAGRLARGDGETRNVEGKRERACVAHGKVAGETSPDCE